MVGNIKVKYKVTYMKIIIGWRKRAEKVKETKQIKEVHEIIDVIRRL